MSSSDRPDPVQMAIFARMTPAQKLELLERIREDAFALKEAWLRQQYPREDESTIARRMRAYRLHGRAVLD